MKKSKQHKKRQVAHNYLPFLLIIVGLASMLYSARYWYFRAQSLSLQEELVAQYVQAQAVDEEAAMPRVQVTHIMVPQLIDIPVNTHIYSHGVWTVDEMVASHLAQSAIPGEAGNIIVYGHNKRTILGNIRALKGGERIVLTTSDGMNHEYLVESVHEVRPTQTEFLEPTSEEVLTMYTCSGLMDQNRFIVRARPR